MHPAGPLPSQAAQGSTKAWDLDLGLHPGTVGAPDPALWGRGLLRGQALGSAPAPVLAPVLALALGTPLQPWAWVVPVGARVLPLVWLPVLVEAAGPLRGRGEVWRRALAVGLVGLTASQGPRAGGWMQAGLERGWILPLPFHLPIPWGRRLGLG